MITAHSWAYLHQQLARHSVSHAQTRPLFPFAHILPDVFGRDQQGDSAQAARHDRELGWIGLVSTHTKLVGGIAHQLDILRLGQVDADLGVKSGAKENDQHGNQAVGKELSEASFLICSLCVAALLF